MEKMFEKMDTPECVDCTPVSNALKRQTRRTYGVNGKPGSVEVRHWLICDTCGECGQTFNLGTKQAEIALYIAGWRCFETETVCPAC